jgi:IclR family acetate operon transcriptional repressor
MGLVRQARPILADVARRCGESTFVAIMRRDRVVPLEAAEACERVVRIRPPLGEALPLHCTAVGKAHLAFDPEQQLRAGLPEQLERFTDRTIVDRAMLFEQLDSVARSGYSIESGEFFEDVAAVAVPIRDYTRSVVGSLAVAGPAYRIPSERISSELAPLILEAGRELSHRLGFNE